MLVIPVLLGCNNGGDMTAEPNRHDTKRNDEKSAARNCDFKIDEKGLITIEQNRQEIAFNIDSAERLISQRIKTLKPKKGVDVLSRMKSRAWVDLCVSKSQEVIFDNERIGMGFDSLEKAYKLLSSDSSKDSVFMCIASPLPAEWLKKWLHFDRDKKICVRVDVFPEEESGSKILPVKSRFISNRHPIEYIADAIMIDCHSKAPMESLVSLLRYLETYDFCRAKLKIYDGSFCDIYFFIDYSRKYPEKTNGPVFKDSGD
jgi:hypothetical protein